MARTVRISEYGGPEVMQIVTGDPPLPGPGQVMIEVRAAGVNPVDWKIRSGKRATGALERPRGLGSDAAGVVNEVAPDVTTFAVGDEVIARGLDGAYASHALARPENLTRKPSALDWSQAAALGVPVGTAYQALKSLGLTSGETLLVHAGAGAVGQAAIQLARHWGATVIATASEANQDRLAELGAIPVTYGPGLLDRVRAAAPGGVDVVLDAAGTDEAIEASLELVADRSRIGTIVLYDRAAELGIQGWTSSTPGYLSDAQRQLRIEAIPYVADLASKGEFDVEIAAIFPLERVAEAHELSETGHVRGKIVLIP
jgi:NADPH:quinone reductase-like Zn-dependent oxidoreductase